MTDKKKPLSDAEIALLSAFKDTEDTLQQPVANRMSPIQRIIGSTEPMEYLDLSVFDMKGIEGGSIRKNVILHGLLSIRGCNNLLPYEMTTSFKSNEINNNLTKLIK